jgi:hypothetical protein
VARYIFQACPVWIYTQSNITQATSYNSFDEFSMVTIVHKQLCD